MSERISYLGQFIWYGLLGRKPGIDFSQLTNDITFLAHYDKRRNVHWVEATNLPEFIVTAKDPKDLGKHIQDTLMVYYDIPRYFAKKIKMPEYKFDYPNHKTKQLETYTSNYKEELDNVLA